MEFFFFLLINNVLITFVGLQKRSDQKTEQKINSIQCSPPRPYLEPHDTIIVYVLATIITWKAASIKEHSHAEYTAV
jgi:hypothetical protein